MDNRNASRQAEYFVSLVDRVKEIPVMLVVGTLIQVYDHNRRPMEEKELGAASYGNYLALCPFHADEKLGSFVITPSKNMWYCFTENIGWSGIHFEMRYYEIGFKQAVFHLARRFSLITEEEYKRYSLKKVDEGVIRKMEKAMEKPRGQENVHTAPPEVINAVYRAIPRVCSLKEKHRKHLLHDRGLGEEDLKDYFSFPTRRMDLAKAVIREIAGLVAQKRFRKPLKALSREELTWLEKDSKAMKQLREELPYVPGFYLDRTRNRIEFTSYKGIGFLVRDDAGKAAGIHIRRDAAKEGEPRYVWFSSSFALSSPACEGGASPGAPGGVVFPKNIENAALCVTEGRFKAEAIARKGNIGVYVSGVSAWKKVLPIIDRLKGSRDKVFVMFDADMMGNAAVHSQLQEACAELQRHSLKPYIVAWPIAKGKGFDDLVLRQGRGYKKCLRYIPFQKFEPVWQGILEQVLAGCGAKRVREIEKEDREKFNASMQGAVEKALFENKEERK